MNKKTVYAILAALVIIVVWMFAYAGIHRKK